jgi:hypothetical protein
MKFVSAWMVLAVAAVLSGCQSTSIRSAWYDTDFAGPPMRKIVVVTGIASVADARAFEDAFAARLRLAGVEGISGHTVNIDDTNASANTFAAAVTNTGAQGLLLVSVLDVDTRTQVSTTMVQGGMGWGRGPWGSASSRSVMPVQQVRQDTIATVEAKLFDVQTRQVVWAATTSTLNPRSIARETPAFADLIVDQLSRRGIIATK